MTAVHFLVCAPAVAGDEGHPEDREELVGHAAGSNLPPFAASAQDVSTSTRDGRDTLERLLAGAPFEKALRALRASRDSCRHRRLTDPHEPTRIGEGQSAEGDGVDDREDGRAGADAQRE